MFSKMSVFGYNVSLFFFKEFHKHNLIALALYLFQALEQQIDPVKTWELGSVPSCIWASTLMVANLRPLHGMHVCLSDFTHGCL